MRRVRVVRRAEAESSGSTGFAYSTGVVAESVGAANLALQLVRVPAGSRSQAHSHAGHESAAYVLEGEVVTWFGDGLHEHVTARAGDFVFIPPDVPHVAVNYGAVDAVAIVARSDASGLESVEMHPDLDDLPHLLEPPGA